MKRSILITIFLFIVSVSFGQIFKIKADSVCEKFDPLEKETEWSDWVIVDVEILINNNEDIITIDNQYDDLFYLLAIGEWHDSIDNSGQKFKTTYFDLRDKDDKWLYALINVYEESVQLVICYVNYYYKYSGTLVESF